VTIWIDQPAWPAHGRLWSHLVSDTSYEELHAFAAAQGIPRRAFEGDHYDVPQERYAALVRAGANATTGRELVRLLQRSGLRIQKRTRERVIRSITDAAWLPPGGRVDVIASRQDTAPSTTVLVRLAVLRDGELLARRRDGGGWDLPSQEVGTHGAMAALTDLERGVLGVGDRAEVERPSLLGYVRNTVPHGADGYPWPIPQASFAVFLARTPTRELLAADGSPDCRWLPLRSAAGTLSARHWWPLLADVEA
jgi:hypothetical protein